jgi:hypothetical protein
MSGRLWVADERLRLLENPFVFRAQMFFPFDSLTLAQIVFDARWINERVWEIEINAEVRVDAGTSLDIES